MKIRTKLLLALSLFPLITLFLIGIVWFQTAGLNTMSHSLKQQYDTTIVVEQIYRKMRNEAVYLRNLLVYMTSPSFRDEQRIEQEFERLQAERESIKQDIQRLEFLMSAEEERVMLEKLKTTHAEFNLYKDEVVGALEAGNTETALELVLRNGVRFQDELLSVITEMTEYYENQVDTSLSAATFSFQRNTWISGLATFIGILLALTVLFRIVWAVAVRLNRVSSVMIGVANGSADLSTRIETTSKDEIDDVANSFNLMAHAMEQENWFKSNTAAITAVLTGEREMASLASTFLSKVSPLVEASHAVFYVKSTDEKTQEPVLKLQASYAFKERKHLVNEFRIGEGLIGQAALEKTPILLTEVPSDYVRIRSGLGEAAPLNIYVLPVMFEGEARAVVEFAALKPFTPVQQAFLEVIVDNAGIVLDSIAGKNRLAKLLQESQVMTEELQVQSEELQTQQEELRAVNEELEEQTQALRQSEAKLQMQQEELEQTNTELKEKAENLELQNKRFEAANREMEKARKELEKQARKLALSSKYKSEFLANMSHELRTPLNSMLILSRLLSDNQGGNLTDKQIEFVRTIYSSGNDLLTLINDVLDLAKVESGKMDVQVSDVSIAAIEEYARKHFQPIANEKKVGFNVVLHDSAPLSIRSDERRIQQVLKNLLSNAFKFTSRGEVTLEIGAGDGDRPAVAIAVKDTGIGIPEDKLELIFEAFQQADGTTSRKFGGTGLGLSISREIAALLGGTITVESAEGSGSVFTFSVGDYDAASAVAGEEDPGRLDEVAVTLEEQQPMPIEMEETPRPAADSSVIKRLLIVDDDPVQRNSLMELIGDKDVIMTAVSTGREAIEELKVSSFDCMVLDLGLTDTTGFELLEQIYENGLDRDLKIFIYTGRELSSKEEIQLKKYTQAIIIKDAHSPQRLLDELELYFQVSGTGVDLGGWSVQNQRSGLAATGLEGKNILVVDDDIRNVFALSSVLEAHGMEVSFAENGSEGLEVLQRSGRKFDLVIMDIMMPEMDGYEAIRRLRDMPELKHLPVIALTAKAMREDRERCMEAGASDYLTKPVDPEQLISCIRVWLYSDSDA